MTLHCSLALFLLPSRDCGQHPQRQLTLQSQGRQAEARGGEVVAWLMEQVATEVRALLQELQDASKARLDPGRLDVQFVPGDLVLLDVDHIPLLSLGLLLPHWQGPFSIVAQMALNTYKLTLPAAWKVVNKFNM